MIISIDIHCHAIKLNPSPSNALGSGASAMNSGMGLCNNPTGGWGNPSIIIPLTGGLAALYPYTTDLLCLNFHQAHMRTRCATLESITTPLVAAEWESALLTHPDRAFTRFILTGIREGFRIGFDRRSPLKSSSRNMQSALVHPEVIQTYIDKECSLGRMLGPFGGSEPHPHPHCHINRFGVIPKGHTPGKWRLITDLSHPPGESVNDGIDPELCSLSYISVEQVANVVARFSPGALLAKIDVESAYRLIPVHPGDRPLQAVEWQGQLYIDAMLPFGLRSAPKLFNAVADGLEWVLRQNGVRHVFHYLDDFIVIGSPNSPECAQALATLNRLCLHLGIPIAEHKRDGPATCLTFLGIEVDTRAFELRLPADKLQRLKILLAEWESKKTCSRRELESLIGLLNHACKVVRSGRAFLRRMIDLLHGVPMHPLRPHPIRLNRAFRSDLVWWRLFASEWNGIAFLSPTPHLPAKVMASDASGLWGCGAWHGNHWFQLKWNHIFKDSPIAVKELLPIVLACAVWGRSWTGHRVVVHCNNQVVVAALRSHTSKNSHCLHMLRVLAFLEARYQFRLLPQYINTKNNFLADALSRDNLALFLSKVPQASSTPVALPSTLIELLLDPTLDWTSPHWQVQFRDILRKAWPPTQGGVMTQP